MIGTASGASSPASVYRQPGEYFETVVHSRNRTQTKRFQPGEFAHDIVRNEHIMTLADEGEIYFYEDGYYHPKGEVYVEQVLCRVLGDLGKHVTRSQKLEVVDQVRRNTVVWNKDISDDVLLLPLKNGVLNWKSGAFGQYEPDRHRFFFQIPVDYDPRAKCPNVLSFLESVVSSQDVEALIEAAASCLHRVAMKLAVLLVGPPDAGKTQYVDFLRTFVGEGNTCTVPLQTLTRERFANSALKDKMANIYDDLSTGALEDTGPFKALTGRGKVPYERKYRDRTDFRPYAKHIFACNALPMPRHDESRAFFERLVIVLFPYSFVKDAPTPGSNERSAVSAETLRAQLTDPSELSGFLNIVVSRMDKVVREGLSSSPASSELRTSYQRQCNSLAAFLHEGCELGGSGIECTKTDFHDAYEMYCDEHDLVPMSIEAVGRKLPDLDRRIQSHRPRYDSDDTGKPRPRMWKGVRPKSQPRRVRWGVKALARGGINAGATTAIAGSSPSCLVPTCTRDSDTSLPLDSKTSATTGEAQGSPVFSGEITMGGNTGYTWVQPGYNEEVSAPWARCEREALCRLVAHPDMTLAQLLQEVVGVLEPDSTEVGSVKYVVTQVFDEYIGSTEKVSR